MKWVGRGVEMSLKREDEYGNIQKEQWGIEAIQIYRQSRYFSLQLQLLISFGIN